ncbi:MAG TPA: DUF3006 domain-containing protein [Clostridiales bacterium]|jgi:hypothetical protein|nr:DUF3006 domain-containing protein [Clostridiales bacterium]HBE12656.1 DUF3006 domain-containing protein [Clostridiales bacterium]HCG35926.1 DUF3006 domain-containing protein [Clostridiales bacterium]
MKVVIDRFEEEYAVVELESGTFADMPRVLVPDAREGDVVEIRIDHQETKIRRERIQNLMKKLFNA